MFRRREPLHERLAREGGLLRSEPPPHDTTPRFAEVGIHGVSRPRKWDAVVVATAPFDQDWVTFVALPDGDLLADDDAPDEALAALAAALETSLQPPYRAEAVRRGENHYAVAARRIRVIEVPEPVDGDEVELVVHDGQRELRIDGERSFGSIPSIERAGTERSASAFISAERLDGKLWEIRVSPL